MRKDAQGFFYFVDRIGDTFRWKGENVSSSEVLNQLTAAGSVREAVVYGVAVSGYEGRAGMAAIVADESFDLGSFRSALSARLPPYARPLFLRRMSSLSLTGTYKVNKQHLLEEGFDPKRVTEPLFVNDERNGVYAPLDSALHAAILDGSFRL
jgi:fatty-acyl-CoA synthase